jgi:hypothetical protein
MRENQRIYVVHQRNRLAQQTFDLPIVNAKNNCIYKL